MHICMNWQSVTFDWNRARAFLVTAEEGSLSAAARALGLTQPTLGRQVSALETELGVTLFERVGRSLVLTQSGHELLDHVRQMGEAASHISLTASGQSQTIEGQVCITAADMVSAYLLPPVLKQLRAEAPGIEIEVIASDSISDLRRREADIAIRHVRPDQPDLIAKLLRETSGHLYASSSYLDRIGRPTTPGELANADFVGLGDNDRLISVLNDLGLSLTRDNFGVSTASGVVAWELVKQGIGIGVTSRDVAAMTPGVEQVLPTLPPVTVPIWLATHRELHTSRRIRLVFDFLAEALSQPPR
ncbi:MAG: LysR family transcriptional regulator [Rhodospirillaceae bacterium]|nr:LysR family transcriptional regulator [Rhodospirillaceae bacterium]MBT5944880.1 LysR family transcriptional regulator [Rhodospirillaceae bacterium]MBT6405478.1 LysR family transcriptional regulator [Rhodospirillaceae bacterium]MBT6535664.1 LysR family transcriptional regulator [Rhodospirillaceae bacterium]MBT7362949.1 LysR family transcriptional regulator [Rhodospirillaceae bacterium]